MTALRIAFTSCMDTVNYPRQPGWTRLAAQRPEHIVLLGDSMYMDYGGILGLGFGPRPREEYNGTPWDLPLDQFSKRMHERYKAQFEVEGFAEALRGRTVHAIWDDHDFGWNNSRGLGVDDKSRLSETQRRISTAHFRQWQQALRNPGEPYPQNAVNPAAPPVGDDAGIGRSVALIPDKLYLHLLDARTFREGDDDGEGLSMLGEAQRQAVGKVLQDYPAAIHIVAVGEPMQKWDHTPDAKWLLDWAAKRHILSICGDIHEPEYTGYKANGKKDFGDKDKTVLHEFCASAMAQGPAVGPKRKEVYGMLIVEDDSVEVQLFVKNEMSEHYKLLRQPVGWISTTLE